MADIYSFKGIRYNTQKIDDLENVVTPPYDKIDSRDRKAFLQKSPYNIIRLILGEGEHQKQEYDRAANYFQDWLQKKVLTREQESSIYVYHQDYCVDGVKKTRKGFVALGKIEEKGKIKAHENTMDGPKADRLRLLRATEANFGHIFMLYSDKREEVNSLLSKAIGDEAPIISVHDGNQNGHKLWCVQSDDIIGEAKELMSDRELYIADGHHRFQTALNFKKECEKKGLQGDFDKRLMTFVNFEDPGLTILPTHRLIYGIENFLKENFLEKLEENFDVVSYENKQEMYRHLDQAKTEENVFGFVPQKDSQYFVIRLKNRNILKNLRDEKSDVWSSLDVAVLHKIILEKYLEIDDKALQEKRNIEYIRGRKQTIKKLNEEDYQAAFILNPTPAEKVRQVADKGEKMPQKSTDFYPKLLTGLVFHKLNIKK